MSEPDRLEQIKAQRAEHDIGDPAYFDWLSADDFDWLVSEVERFREELAPCGEVGCPHAHAVPTRRAEGRSTE